MTDTPTPEDPAAPPQPAATGPWADEPLAPECTIDDFAKVDLRVARIAVAEQVEGADKLLRLELELGGETRQVFAGIKRAYNPAELVGRLTVCVANLAPRKMRFGVSQGMVLAASDGAVISANKWGKIKTTVQMIYVGVFMFMAFFLELLDTLPALARALPGDPGHYQLGISWASLICIILVALYTVYSGVQFARVNWASLNLTS